MSTDATVTEATVAATAAAAIKARWAAEATSDPVTGTAAVAVAVAVAGTGTAAVSASVLLERLQNRQIALKAELELCLQCEQVQEQNARYEQQIATCWSRLRE